MINLRTLFEEGSMILFITWYVVSVLSGFFPNLSNIARMCLHQVSLRKINLSHFSKIPVMLWSPNLQRAYAWKNEVYWWLEKSVFKYFSGNGFYTCKWQVIGPSWWYHLLSSIVKSYLWSKFQVSTLHRIWKLRLQETFALTFFINISLQKTWSFPLRISSVNVTKSGGNCRFCHIYWRNL